MELLKKIIFSTVFRKVLKVALMPYLRGLAKRTDNTLDDDIVDAVDSAL
jgi:hypothetical protein